MAPMDVEKEKDKTKAGTDKGKKDGDKKKSEEETATSILTTGQLAADEIEVIVHPLVLLSTVDHYNRVAKDTRKRVVGVLLGTTWRGRIDVVNSFAVPFEEDLKNPLIWQYEQQMEDEERLKQQREMEFDATWTAEDRREGRVGNWRDFQKGPGAKRAKVQSWTVEENAKNKPKFGQSSKDEWKKNWK
ncbi:hypothetical protein VYU27_007826 [Nannochloropsis oceanica]